MSRPTWKEQAKKYRLCRFTDGDPENDVYYYAEIEESETEARAFLSFCDQGGCDPEIFYRIIEEGKLQEVPTIDMVPEDRREEIPYGDAFDLPISFYFDLL